MRSRRSASLSPIEVGGFATVDAPEGGRTVVQVRDLHTVEREALSIEVDVSDVVPGAAHASVRPVFRSLSGSAVVLGHLDESGFTAANESVPFGERNFRPIASDDVRAHHRTALDRDVPTIEVGTMFGTTPARLPHAGLPPGTRSCADSRVPARRTRRGCCSNGS